MSPPLTVEESIWDLVEAYFPDLDLTNHDGGSGSKDSQYREREDLAGALDHLPGELLRLTQERGRELLDALLRGVALMESTESVAWLGPIGFLLSKLLVRRWRSQESPARVFSPPDSEQEEGIKEVLGRALSFADQYKQRADRRLITRATFHWLNLLEESAIRQSSFWKHTELIIACADTFFRVAEVHNEPDSFRKAASMFTEALESSDENNSRRVWLCHNIGFCWLRIYKFNYDRGALDSAIAFAQAASALLARGSTSEADSEYVERRSLVGSVESARGDLFGNRFLLTGDVGDLRAKIHCYEIVSVLSRPGDPLFSRWLGVLASTLIQYSDVTGLDHLDRAITLLSTAVEHSDSDPGERKYLVDALDAALEKQADRLATSVRRAAEIAGQPGEPTPALDPKDEEDKGDWRAWLCGLPEQSEIDPGEARHVVSTLYSAILADPFIDSGLARQVLVLLYRAEAAIQSGSDELLLAKVKLCLAKVLLGAAERGEEPESLEKAIAEASGAASMLRPAAHRSEWLAAWLDAKLTVGQLYLQRHWGDRSENVRVASGVCREVRPRIARLSGAGYWRRLQVLLAQLAMAGGDLLDQAVPALLAALSDIDDSETSIKGDVLELLSLAFAGRLAGALYRNLDIAIDRAKEAIAVRESAGLEVAAARAKSIAADLCARRFTTGNHLVATNKFAAEAEQWREAASRTLTRERFPHEAAALVTVSARLKAAAREWGRAEGYWSQAIDILERQMQSPYGSSSTRVKWSALAEYYFDRAGCKLKRGDYGGALIDTEIGKTKLMGRGLSSRTWQVPGLSPEETLELRKLLSEIGSIETSLDHEPYEGGRYDEMSRALASKWSRVEAIVGSQAANDPAMTFERIRAAVPAGGALVSFLFSEFGYAAFVVSREHRALGKEDVIVFEKESYDLLRQLTEEWRQQIRAASEQIAMALNSYNWQSLYSSGHFNGPQETQLMAVSRILMLVFDRIRELRVERGAEVVLIPQAGLGLLPVHAMPISEFRVDADTPLVIEEYAVSYAPCASVRKPDLEARALAPDSLLSVLDPGENLRMAQVEGAIVAEAHDASRARRLCGRAAGKVAVWSRLADFRYAHFSCHGMFNERDPGRSCLLMANGDTLTASEIAQRKGLDQCRLLVLSGCETGVSDSLARPHEYVGLSSAFLLAGAGAVVSTLWPVSDVVAMFAIGRFAEEVFRERQSPAVSLRRAQLWLRDATFEDLLQWGRGWVGRLKLSDPKSGFILEDLIWRFSKQPDLKIKPFRGSVLWSAFAVFGG